MPLEATGAKLLKTPPVASMSASTKLLLASDSVKVRVSAPVAMPVPKRLTAILGGAVSATKVL